MCHPAVTSQNKVPNSHLGILGLPDWCQSIGPYIPMLPLYPTAIPDYLDFLPTPLLSRELKEHLLCDVFQDFTPPYEKRKAGPSELP